MRKNDIRPGKMTLGDIQHKPLVRWIGEMSLLCEPSEGIVIIDGSEEQKKELCEKAVSSGELIMLDQQAHPGCFYHRSFPGDAARSEACTYICTPDPDLAGSKNNWMSPQEGYDKAKEILAGSMNGRTMYVIPFSMGPIGSPHSMIGVQLTDSLYVVLNMLIMTRVDKKVLDILGYNGEFCHCLHGLADRNPQRRLILHFPKDNAIWSCGSGYGGNALLGKKCLSLRIASYKAWQEGWLAEHMLIMGIKCPDGRILYGAFAFPSSCGKTNLAMLVPPKALLDQGYEIYLLGDDIAWLFPSPDGKLWAINPENGFFGVAPGTNSLTNPNAMATIKTNTIFTNVGLAEGRVWWQGGDGPEPEQGLDWQGHDWHKGLLGPDNQPVNPAHPNSRFTAPLSQCPCVSNRTEHPWGVPIDFFGFGGRRKDTMPLVFQATSWQHGVYTAATMASQVTAAQEGDIGNLRFDPMAMLPFVGYNMNYYLSHWLRMANKLSQPPQIFHVNWFKQGPDGKFLWPGYGDNLRVLKWMIDRCRKNTSAISTPLGYMPRPEDLDLTGLDIPPANVEQLLTINPEEWRKEMQAREQFMETLGPTMPSGILKEHLALAKRLGLG